MNFWIIFIDTLHWFIHNPAGYQYSVEQSYEWDYFFWTKIKIIIRIRIKIANSHEKFNETIYASLILVFKLSFVCQKRAYNLVINVLNIVFLLLTFSFTQLVTHSRMQLILEITVDSDPLGPSTSCSLVDGPSASTVDTHSKIMTQSSNIADLFAQPSRSEPPDTRATRNILPYFQPNSHS